MSTASDPAVKTRLLTGDRPSGRLHLGHWVGSLRARVALQDDHECFNIVADLHTLTMRPGADDIARLPERVRDLVLDVLAAGVDPERTVLYLQSGVPAVYDLAILLGMLARADRLANLESVQALARDAHVSPDAISLGLLGYPVLQAADILMARAEVVPVGEENVAHVEIARDLATRFNETYGDVFPVPEIRSDRSLVGLDAAAQIHLDADAEAVARTVDELSHEALISIADALLGDASQTNASDADLRVALVPAIESTLSPIRARRAELAAQKGLVEELLFDGTVRAREVAYDTLGRVREAMGLESLWQGIVREADRRAQQRKKPY
jgi:tryptophanyl-tRNA synthetase